MKGRGGMPSAFVFECLGALMKDDTRLLKYLLNCASVLKKRICKFVITKK